MLGKTDVAWKFGCGRYIQRRNALELMPGEIERLGGKAVYLAGNQAYEALCRHMPDLMEPLQKRIRLYSGPCSMEAAKRCADWARDEGAKALVGMGGGKMMDLAKMAAQLAGLPVVLAPTITATCAAYTALSVMYDEAGRTVGSWFHETEVDCVIADTALFARQPARYGAAGMLDSMAKACEMAHYGGDVLEKMEMRTAYQLARDLFERLNRLYDRVMEDLRARRWSENIEELTFLTIPVTGMISGIARGSFQSAVGHAFYEEMRRLYPERAAPYLHGELVGLGLRYQTAYTGISKSEVNRILSKASIPDGAGALGLSVREGMALADGIAARLRAEGKEIDRDKLWTLLLGEFQA